MDPQKSVTSQTAPFAPLNANQCIAQPEQPKLRLIVPAKTAPKSTFPGFSASVKQILSPDELNKKDAPTKTDNDG